MRALYTAATGMMARNERRGHLEQRGEPSHHGLQAPTRAFPGSDVRAAPPPGAPSSEQNTQVPVGVFVGSGVKVVSTPRLMTQGI